jgi:hypothetical protein
MEADAIGVVFLERHIEHCADHSDCDELPSDRLRSPPLSANMRLSLLA